MIKIKKLIFSKKELLKKYFPYIRIFIGLLSISFVLVIAINSIKETEVTQEVVASEIKVLGIMDTRYNNSEILIESQNDVSIALKEPLDEEIEVAKTRYQEKLVRLEEERKQREEQERILKQKRVEDLHNFLVRQGSPMADYSELILDSCEKYGMHYCKFYLSIAGVESGFGRVCSNYSAWGMILVKYPSWEVAIPRAADWIAQNYYLKGYNTFEKLSYDSPYGPHNKEKWVNNLYSFYNIIPI